MNSKILGLVFTICIFLILILVNHISSKEHFNLGNSLVIEKPAKPKQGPQGDKGEKGEDGDQGTEGEMGPRGGLGARGSIGPTGKVGRDGEVGNSLKQWLKSKYNDLEDTIDDKLIYSNLLNSEYTSNIIADKVADKLKHRLDSVRLPDYSIVFLNLTEDKDQISYITDDWQICDGSRLLYEGKGKDGNDVEVNPPINTPIIDDFYLQGSDFTNKKNINKLNKTIISIIPELKLSADQIPSISFTGVDTLLKKINDKSKTISTSLKTSLESIGEDIDSNINKQCQHIKGFDIKKDEGGHKHTVNWFNNNFNEYGIEGEPCTGNWWEDPKCGGTGDIKEGVEWRVSDDARPGFVIDDKRKYPKIKKVDSEVHLNLDPTTVNYRSDGLIPSKEMMNDTKFKQALQSKYGIDTTNSTLPSTFLKDIWRDSFVTQGEGKHLSSEHNESTGHTLGKIDETIADCKSDASYSFNPTSTAPTLDSSKIDLKYTNEQEAINLNQLDAFKLLFLIKRPKNPDNGG